MISKKNYSPFGARECIRDEPVLKTLLTSNSCYRRELDQPDSDQHVQSDPPRCRCNCRKRHVQYAICVLVACLLMTIISVLACSIALRRTESLSQELQILLETQRRQLKHDLAGDEPVVSFQSVGRRIPSESSTHILERFRRRVNRKRKKSGKSKGRKFCKKVTRCQQQSSKDPGNSTEIHRASHFTIDGTSVHKSSIGNFKPVLWMPSNVEKAALVSNSQLTVTGSGVYLVYSSVLFNDTKFREGLAIMRNNEQLFVCFDGVDHIDIRKSRFDNFKLKTCSISGVVYLEKGDNLEMVNMYANTNIDTNAASTYFGLVQLIPSASE